MRIAPLSPLAESVPPHASGGPERVVDWLCRELVARGHDVTLFASGDSHTAGTLVPVVDRALRLGAGGGGIDALALHLVAVEMLRERIAEFDVVHSHVDHIALG